MQAQDPRTPWMDAAEELSHVLSAQKGDRKAFLALLRHYHRPVYRLAFALTRDVQTAAVVTHAAVLKAKEGVRYMADGRRFFPWVASIVRKLARARHRPGDFEGTPPGADPGVVDLAKRLLLTMDGLDPDEQAAVALRIAELLPHSLIEAVLRVTPGSAPSLLAGARLRLAALVQVGEPQQVGHLAPDQLSAHLDGALEGESFDLVRRHLEGCEICRAQCLRMASADDVLTALLTHDPDDRFFAALQGFLEQQFHANDPAGSIPPELERLLATESARLDARRWAAVRQAIPRPPVISASAVRPLGIASRPEPAAPAGAPDAAAAPLAGVVIPAAAQHFPGPTPIPAMAPLPASRRTEPSLRRGGSSRFIAAAIVALVLILAGLYLTRTGSRARAGNSHVASGSARTMSAPVLPVADSRAGSKVVDLPEPRANDSAATSDTAAPAAKDTGAPETLAAAPAAATTGRGASSKRPAVAPDTAPAVLPAAAPRRASAASRPAAPPPVGPERGILCGQVRDERGMPIVRAQVLLADLHVGVLTDPRGRFCISVPIGSRTVSVVALGFTTQRRTVTIGRKTPEFAVTLRSAAVQESPSDGSP
jgi:DNA-directed RNA polymerase specialized sigma24 family protein